MSNNLIFAGLGGKSEFHVLMEGLVLIIVLLAIPLVLLGLSLLGWFGKGLGVVFDVFTEGLKGCGGCLMKIFVAIFLISFFIYLLGSL